MLDKKAYKAARDMTTKKIKEWKDILCNGTEECVLCGHKTDYKKNDHIHTRECYVEGIGQLCERCFYQVY